MSAKIRLLRENDLPLAQKIFSLAFGTFLGASEPEKFWSDLDYIKTRWYANPTAAFGAEIDGVLVGSNFANHWGSIGLFGPLTVHPDFWNCGIGKQLMQPVLDCYSKWQVGQAGVLTFAQSPKHIGLYQQYGFYPRFLTTIMSKPVAFKKNTNPFSWSKYSELSESERKESLQLCYYLTDSIYPGLDLKREINSVLNQGLGETVLIWHDVELIGLAICHCGANTEAGNHKCYIKFGAVKSGVLAEKFFEQLLHACENLAHERGLQHLDAGVNLARDRAFRQMITYGFCPNTYGIVMHRPNEPGYNRSEVYLIDDWR